MLWNVKAGERESEREGECCCPEKKNGVLPPLIMAPRAGKDAGGRGGPDEAVGKGLAHGD